MEIKAKRTAFLPGERIELEAVAGAPNEVRWSGGGAPASGEGARFRTTFDKGGTYSIRAECREGSVDLAVEVAQIDEWLERASQFFGPSLDIGRVTVKASRWVVGARGSAWTCNTVVRFKRPMRTEDLPSESTLIHELGHVWEHVAGQVQLLSGLRDQAGRLFGLDPYDFGGPAGVRDAKTPNAILQGRSGPDPHGAMEG